MPLLRSIMDVNARRPAHVIQQVLRHFPSLVGRRVAVLGLAFKPDTDDVRESPAFPIIRALVEAGARVSAHDPVANAGAQRVLNGLEVEYCDGLPAAIDGADAIILVTRWKEFGILPDLLKTVAPAPLVFDGRRMLDKDAVERYDGIGL
jgi:UDPglucose 6-dehydrogenase/GDP-mannose 6-dehydrogenase